MWCSYLTYNLVWQHEVWDTASLLCFFQNKAELLSIDSKVAKAIENKVWESRQHKYSEIVADFEERYPKRNVYSSNLFNLKAPDRSNYSRNCKSVF